MNKYRAEFVLQDGQRKSFVFDSAGSLNLARRIALGKLDLTDRILISHVGLCDPEGHFL